MQSKNYRATLSKGRSGWCVIFRHPAALASDGKNRLRVRRGLGTRDEAEAKSLVDKLNELLADSTYWNPGARSRAATRYPELIVNAFFDHLTADEPNGWGAREQVLPLPSKEDGYAKVQLVGTTGAGKTTVVRQLLGTDPKRERFPSTSAAKTTVSDLELIVGGPDFQAVVSFISREQARHYIMECISAAVSAYLERNQSSEVVRRFMEHSEQKFRLSYLLGDPTPPESIDEDELLDDDDDGDIVGEDAEVTHEERVQFADRIASFLQRVFDLSHSSAEAFRKAALDLGIDLTKTTPQERDALQDLVEEELVENEDFHLLVDDVLDEVEARFEYVSNGTLVRGRDGWPALWTMESEDRREFLRSVNRFSSNYAPNFGKLLTPLVEGIRVQGPFLPSWHDGDRPKLVLLDGQGIGHTADSTSSVSTNVTKRFQLADVIVLVDNAAQPMQAAPMSVLRTLIASGYESKLVLTFTHFDEVKGDNLTGMSARKSHVVGSFFNAVQAIGKSSGRLAEHALKRLYPERVVFLAGINTPLPDAAKFTRSEFRRLLATIELSIAPEAPVECKPVYDVANLVLAVQKATQEFHDRWNAVLGLGSRSNVKPEHWTRIKALSRRVGIFRQDEYDDLRPVADLIIRLQEHISSFLSEPLEWEPPLAPMDPEDLRVQAVDAIRREVNQRLHELSRRRMIDERLIGWVEAYELKGTGSSQVRAKELHDLYGSAAPVPNEMPASDANEFLFELRELVAESIDRGGGLIRSWTRKG